ncbi:MAG: hypothetical protein LBM00_06315 [Deltaproteobacteria bacterium]|jgi:hypothetical protein|nr:hypothetical protein [Deltaproteobacteria bacterium]
MRNIGKKQPAGQRSSGILKRALLHLFLLALLWGVFTFVVIPWDTNKEYPADTFPLIEGQRAYAEIVRASRPNYLTSLRGLHMVRAKYTQERLPDQTVITTGNVRLSFDPAGEFLSLEILK